MKIGIYNAPVGEGIGGAEYCSAVLAGALARDHDVEIVHHKATMQLAGLSRTFAVDLHGCRSRYVPKEWEPYPTGLNPFRRYAAARAWSASLSAPYDLFFAFTQDLPAFCHARHGVLCVLFPNHERPLDIAFREEGPWLIRQAKRLYSRFEWSSRMKTWDRKLAISDFTRTWTERRWKIDCDILHPPGGKLRDAAPAAKTLAILSVGRFTTHGHQKRQRETMSVYRELAGRGHDAWTYHCIGNLTDLPEDRAYFDDVSRMGEGLRSDVRSDLDRDTLDSLFRQASIFWHAAGYAIDESTQPQLVEHYGLSTVEAMAAGCIPVVIDRGGQREIVRHGVNGFLWNTLAELRDFTETLINDAAMRDRMSRAARERARELSEDAFVDRARKIISPFIA